MKKLYHRGAPCHPPVVNGLTFEPSEEHPGYHVAEGTEEQVDGFKGVPQFFDHPDNDPALAVQEPSAPLAGSPDMDAILAQHKAACDDLTSENAKLKGQVVDLTAKVDTLAVENAALREQLAELEADDDGDETGADLDTLDAEIKALEAKKAAGQASKPEIMKLGKLKKKLEAALKK